MLHSVPIWLVVLAAASQSSGADTAEPHRSRTVQGRVVWAADALARLHGIELEADVGEQTLVLETATGALFPLVEDERGRAFRRDARLRDIEVEVLARQHQGSPFLQVMKLYALEQGRRYELDYWCDICAIAMFELKPCDCCQGPIELRRREVNADGQPLR